jgi:hypothetical protein
LSDVSQRFGNGGQGQPKDFGDFPISKTFGPQVEAVPLLRREYLHRGTEPGHFLLTQEEFFWTGRWVRLGLAQLFPFICARVSESLFSFDSIDGDVMSHAKQPPSQVIFSAVLSQVLMELQKTILYDLVDFGWTDSQANEIAI